MPRRAKPEHPELPFNSPELVPVDPDTAAADEAEGAPRKMGRPRKWASEAERKRAYRERLAADHAEPERLRRELRNARRQVADRDRRLAEAERDLARAEAEIERRSKREIELEGTVRRLEAKVDDWRSRANALSRNLEAEREGRLVEHHATDVRDSTESSRGTYQADDSEEAEAPEAEVGAS